MFNKVILMGNLTRDPEVRYTPQGTSVCNFGIAVNRKYKQGDELKEEVTFINIVVFGKQAVFLTITFQQVARDIEELRHFRRNTATLQTLHGLVSGQ